MKSIVLKTEINAPKAKVWDILFNRFGEVNNFNPLIEGSHHIQDSASGVGCERQCNLDAKGKKAVIERITRASPNDSFDIEIVKGGLPMMDKMDSTWTVKDLGDNQTRVEITFRYTTKPAFMAGLMKFPMRGKLFEMVVGLKYHLEKGELINKRNIGGIMKRFKKLGPTQAF